jgi:hypothetical protein
MLVDLARSYLRPPRRLLWVTTVRIATHLVAAA